MTQIDKKTRFLTATADRMNRFKKKNNNSLSEQSENLRCDNSLKNSQSDQSYLGFFEDLPTLTRKIFFFYDPNR